MPEKYKQLARHNSVCDEVYYKLQDCQREHPLAKFIGECTSFEQSLAKCIKSNREDMRTKNKAAADEKHRQMKQAINQGT